MSTMTDRYQPLRDAIGAGPTPGKWEVGGMFDNDGQPEIVIDRKTPVGNLAIAVCLPGLAGQKANAAFITAACNSARALLEERDRLREALRIFIGCQYPVSTEIDSRGYTWCEAYLDEALKESSAALNQSEQT